MDYMEVVKEITQEAFDPWRFNKLEKQYMGDFDEEECLRILQKHFPQGAKNTEKQVQSVTLHEMLEMLKDCVSELEYSAVYLTGLEAKESRKFIESVNALIKKVEGAE